MHSREAILEQVRAEFFELFEIARDRVRPEARLYQDLEIDSIDAIDILARVHRLTDRKVSPEEFRSVKTVGDLVDVVQRLTQAP